MIVFGLFVLIASYVHVSALETIKGPPGEYGSQYILINEELTFDQLVTKCASLGANLPTPKTQAEVDFVFKYANSFIPIGAKVKKVNGRCVVRWLVDGSEVTNAQWHPSWSNCDGDEKCIEFGDSRVWYMNRCSVSYTQSLCQKKTREDRMKDLSPSQEKSISLALPNMERQLQETMVKNDKKIDSLSSNVNVLTELFKKMATDVSENKRKLEYLYG